MTVPFHIAVIWSVYPQQHTTNNRMPLSGCSCLLMINHSPKGQLQALLDQHSRQSTLITAVHMHVRSTAEMPPCPGTADTGTKILACHAACRKRTDELKSLASAHHRCCSVHYSRCRASKLLQQLIITAILIILRRQWQKLATRLPPMHPSRTHAINSSI